MLGWDRVVGNFLEQAVPFLTLFMINVALATLGVTSSSRVRSAGWVYVAFRALYPVRHEHLPHSCGQQPLWCKTGPEACSNDKLLPSSDSSNVPLYLCHACCGRHVVRWPGSTGEEVEGEPVR